MPNRLYRSPDLPPAPPQMPGASPWLLIRVPGSTSNLGPGFDALGLALSLFNDFTMRQLPAGEPDRLRGQGTCAGLQAEGNPLLKMFDAICQLAGRPRPPLEVVVDGNVPVGAGLGSSATACVAGALAANYFLGQPFTREQLLQPLIQAEGHPDNVTPCLLGGLTLTALVDGTAEEALPVVHVYQPHASWYFVVLVPSYEVSTNKARKLLPGKVQRADAVFNLARTPLVIDALVAGDLPELRRVMVDRLHEPARAELIKRHDRIRGAARELGAATFISGSGPSIAACCLGEVSARELANRWREVVADAKFQSEILLLRAENEGARLAELD